MTPYASLSIALFVFLASCNTCNQRTREVQTTILGRWEIVRALRNEKPTETLTGVYFEFNADGNMLTNLPIGPEELVVYEVTEKEVRQKGAHPVIYSIKSLTDSTLILVTELRGMQFEMQLQRPSEVPAVEEDISVDSSGNI